MTGADYSSGESFAYAYDPVGNPVLLRFAGRTPPPLRFVGQAVAPSRPVP
ncbi:MAG: hypothetical protein P8186_25745 [Anaerolineae bacterium]